MTHVRVFIWLLPCYKFVFAVLSITKDVPFSQTEVI